MPANATEHRVGELISAGVLTVNDGYRAKNSELGNHGLPFARAGNIDGGFNFEGADRFPKSQLDAVSEKISRPGDVVFTSKGTVGRFAFVNDAVEQFVYSPQLCYWRSLDPKRILPRWLFYWLQGREFFLQYNGVKGQTDMADYVSLRDQRAMHISIPAPEYQHRAVEILGSIDDKIELNRRTNETLEAMARAIFKSWFVDFDPVRAKSEGHKPAGMDEATAALFPNVFQPSPLGPIPKRWEALLFSDLAELSYGKSLPAESRQPGDVVVVGSGGIVGTHDQHLVSGPGIVVGRKGTVGSVLWVDEDFFPIDTTFYVEPKSGVPLEWLFHVLRGIDMLSLGADSAVPGVNRHAVYMQRVATPGRGLLSEFAQQVKPLLHLCRSNTQENALLEQLRDALLPKLLSGELSVGSAG